MWRNRQRTLTRSTSAKQGIPIKHRERRHWRRHLPRLDVRALFGWGMGR